MSEQDCERIASGTDAALASGADPADIILKPCVVYSSKASPALEARLFFRHFFFRKKKWQAPVFTGLIRPQSGNARHHPMAALHCSMDFNSQIFRGNLFQERVIVLEHELPERVLERQKL